MLLTLSLFAQSSRQQLESERLELIRQIENSENELSRLQNEKTKLIAEINRIELEIEDPSESESEDILVPIKEAQSPQTNAEAIIEPNSETYELSTTEKAAYIELLRIRYRDKLLSRSRTAQDNQELLSAEARKWKIFDTYEKQLLAKLDLPNTTEQIASTPSETQVKSESTESLTTTQPKESNRAELEDQKEFLMMQAISLNREEQRLTAQIKNLKSNREKYNQSIEALLTGNTKSSTINPSSGMTSPPAYTSSGIASKKGFLSWPLVNHNLLRRYGPQSHPTEAGVSITNHGVDLTSSSSEVSAIYDGTVLDIAAVSNNGQTVIIQHDNDYYTVYANLESLYIIKGTTVSRGQTIGVAKRNSSNLAELHFEIWQGKTNLNPKHWLQNN